MFAQRADARVDIDAWNAHAERFFDTRLGLTTDKSPRDAAPPPAVDDVVFVVAPRGEPPALRRAYARPCRADDLARAEAAEARSGAGGGLAMLARRCGMVWLVALEQRPDDGAALRLASLLASVLLGPILDGARAEIFGVKTARAKLDELRRRHTTRS